jgi:hypothetical protein
MTDPEQIDWSPLDPSRDRARWQQLVAATARRARAARKPTLLGQLVAWGRPAIAGAAALAVIAWGGSGWRQNRAAEQARTAREREQAVLLSRWAESDELPPPEVLLRVVGGGHDDR